MSISEHFQENCSWYVTYIFVTIDFIDTVLIMQVKNEGVYEWTLLKEIKKFY
jgi:hypothetical protein